MSLEVPSTDRVDVARMAVAWNIVSTAYARELPSKEDVEAMTEAYIKTYNAILNNEMEQHSGAISAGGFSG